MSKWGCSYYTRNVDTTRYLLDRGMDPDHMNWHHTGLLHDMAHDGRLDLADLLLDYGADIDAVDEEYCTTPLGLAARAGRRDMVQLLLSRGADPERCGAPWARPVEWAVKRGHADIARLIAARGGRASQESAGAQG